MEFVSGNIYIREMRFDKAGEVVEGHGHRFDHTTIVIRGALKIEHVEPLEWHEEPSPVATDPPLQVVTKWKTVREVVKRAVEGHNWVLIKAGVIHRITALEANTLAHCVYSHRTPQGEIVQESDGWMGAFQ